ncbi:hypothetical protein [uncultured Nostoc sp.]|uniref:hypothetical protein n=1 Tax=uncultured Nostoc sp. TaxID=340711 RepID=UPI0035C94E92
MEATQQDYISIRIRKLPYWVEHTHRGWARARGESLEQYLRELLTKAALLTQNQFAEKISKKRKEIASRLKSPLPDTTVLLREERDNF